MVQPKLDLARGYQDKPPLRFCMMQAASEQGILALWLLLVQRYNLHNEGSGYMFMPHKRIEPGIGQESVWDYPRPPRLEKCQRQIRIIYNGEVIAESQRTKRILETSHPPVYYIPRQDIRMETLQQASGASLCEWKGQAKYYNVVVDDQVAPNAAWTFPNPVPEYRGIQNYIAFYPSKMDLCTVDGEEVVAQEGDFYGGWITSDIVGPFKGIPGSRGW